MTPRESMRAARTQATAAGCTCRPDVTYRGVGLVEVAHDEGCPLSCAGQTAIMSIPGRNGLMCAFDLTHGIAIAEQSGAIVITTTPPAMIVPPGADVPPTMAEFGDIERVERPGGTVRICTLSDEWAAGMMAQVSA